MKATTLQKLSALLTPSGDTGALTNEKYRYQHACALHLLLDPVNAYQAIVCEWGDDLLAICGDSEFHAYQVKDTGRERRWRLEDDEVIAAFCNFAQLRRLSTEVTRFFFFSNQAAESRKSKTASSPVLFLNACQSAVSPEALPVEFQKTLAMLAQKTKCDQGTLFEVLCHTEFLLGPTQTAWQDETVARLAEYRDFSNLPYEVLLAWRDLLLGRIGEASSSPGIGRRAELSRRVVQRELLEETLASVLGRPSILVQVLGINSNPVRRFDGSVANFLSHYAGTDSQPRPFAGRAEALAALDRWLEQSAPPYWLITAEAGLGKSALLVAWSRRVVARPGIDVLFYPISHRFQTNSAAQTFHDLYVKLSSVLGISDSVVDPSGVTDWRGRFAGLLHRVRSHSRTVLLILDGLDEALDWEAGPDLFSPDPPSNLRILVAARPLAGDTPQRNWRTRLGWGPQQSAPALEIDALDAVGVTACVEQVAQQWTDPNRADLCEQILRLTGGDPLLLQFYLETVPASADQARAAQVIATLRDSNPGYEPFIDCLFAQTKSSAPDLEKGERFFETLACAFGPMRAEELRACGTAGTGPSND